MLPPKYPLYVACMGWKTFCLILLLPLLLSPTRGLALCSSSWQYRSVMLQLPDIQTFAPPAEATYRAYWGDDHEQVGVAHLHKPGAHRRLGAQVTLLTVYLAPFE